MAPRPAMDVRTVAWLQGEPALNQLAADQQPANPEPAPLPTQRPRLDLNIPPEVPGSEARRIELSKDPATKQREIEALFPLLPPLVAEPMPLPGPDGRPFTLSDFQQIAAVNSPQLKQAASDVEAARGNMMQADAYPNPTLSYQFTPSSNGSTPGADGVGFDQTIKTGGKLRLQSAAAEMALHNAELALKRARSDLSTQVRNAYFAVLVAKETVRVNRALAHFTDEVYHLQANLLIGRVRSPLRTGGTAGAGLHRAAGLPAVDSDLYLCLEATRVDRSTCGNCRSRKSPAASIRPSPTTIMTPSWPTSSATTRTC